MKTLLDAIAGVGFAVPGKIIWDGQIHRFATDLGKQHSQDGWYIAFDDEHGKAAAFGSWREDTKHTWHQGNGKGRVFSQQEWDEIERKRSASQSQRADSHIQAAARAAAIYESASPQGESEYLQRKGIGWPDGCRWVTGVQAKSLGFKQDSSMTALVVPLYGASGALQSLQFIPDPPAARKPKLFLPGSSTKGGFHGLGSPTPVLFISEGLATAQSIREATDLYSVIAFSAANLIAVAQLMRERYPEATIIVCGDNDPLGREKALAAGRLSDARVVFPPEGVNDFNDLHAGMGLTAVHEALFPPVKKPAYCLFTLTQKGVRHDPHSTAASTIAAASDDLVYDEITQRWLMYREIGWMALPEHRAFAEIRRRIDAGMDGHGYGLSYITGVSVFLKALLVGNGFDNDQSLVPFKNGVLDLKRGCLRPHAPELRLTWCLPFNFDPRASCEPVQAFLLESVGGDALQVELLRAFIRAVITGRSDLQRYLEIIGPGGTGKGTFIRLCEALVGSQNSHVTALKYLEDNRFETARLYRKRLCVVTDAEKYSGDVSILKAMTGGDNLPFEEKYRQGGENFRFTGMVLLAANQDISTSDQTSGLQRRRVTVRFEHQVDPTHRRDLEAEFKPYLSGVIAWALEMTEERMKELLVDTIKMIPSIKKISFDVLTSTNPLACWVEDCVSLESSYETQVGIAVEVRHTTGDPGDTKSHIFVEKSDEWLYPNYVEWCLRTGHKRVSSRQFTPLLKDLLCDQLKLAGVEKLEKGGRKQSRFKGIKLKTEQNDTQEGILSSVLKEV